VYVFGAPLKIAGTLSTIAALPAVALAFTGYTIRDHVLAISGYMLIVVLSAASIVGPTIGVALLPTVSDTALRLLLGTVLVISAIRFDARPLAAPEFRSRSATPA
jgi:uncharacterized protein